jgi:Uncharacterised protein family UPF0547
MQTDQARLESELAAARDALEHGRLRRALGRAWAGGHAAARLSDRSSLSAVIEVAEAIRDRTAGRQQAEAARLVSFCSHCLADADAGIRRSASPFGRLLGFDSAQRADEAVKTCPDCAETVKAAARVCRFCGYRFR